MNLAQLTQKLEQAAQAWQDETQSALQRALLVDVMAHPDRAKRWEAIRSAILQQSDELRKLRSSDKVDASRQSWRRELAAALGMLEPNAELPFWNELVAKAYELRCTMDRNIAAHTQGRDEAKESDRQQLAEALGLMGLTWTDLLAYVRELRGQPHKSEESVRAQQRDVDANELAVALGVQGGSWPALLSAMRQRSEDAAELREALGVPHSDWKWFELIAQARELRGIRKDAAESAIATDEQINRANLAALSAELGLPDRASWDMAITEVRRLRYAAVQMVDAFGELSVSAADEKSMKAYLALSGQIRRLQTRPDASATVDMCAQAEAGTPK